MLKKFPLVLNTLREILHQDCLYIDKTEYAYKMISGGWRYFLSRPRRFGKSLFVSTLEEILKGNKELFKDLWIGKSDYAWQQYVVLKFEFSKLDLYNHETFRESLCAALKKYAADYGIQNIRDTNSPSILLNALIEYIGLSEKKVAVLVDEYDNPITHNMIKNFFSTLKALDEYVGFVFITGVSSFAKAGLFSGMNNLRILTLNQEYNGVCGYTNQELDVYFKDYIQDWAQKKDIAARDLREYIRNWYNGYRFGTSAETVYNPFSVLNAFTEKKLDNFWIISGTPAFLIDELKKSSRDLEDESLNPENFRVSEETLGVFDINTIPLAALLFQTGYLTIADYEIKGEQGKERLVYHLKYPNHEVQTAFEKYLLVVFTAVSMSKIESIADRIYNALAAQKFDKVIEQLKILFAAVPYQIHISQEKFYHALMQAILLTAGVNVQSEESTSHGRIDLIVTIGTLIYIIEIKFNKDPQDALTQIHERDYFRKYLHADKNIICVGVSFNRSESNFDIVYVEEKLL